MTPNQLKLRRLELGLTEDEMAFALNITVDEVRRIEAGQSDFCYCAQFQDAVDALEERVFGLLVGA